MKESGRSLHIGVDLDNTILDATASHLYYYNLASGLTFVPEDVNDFYIYRLYGWTPDERDSVYLKYGRDIHWNSIPFKMAVETLRELFRRHRITIVTARPLIYRDITLEWLEHYNVEYHDIVFAENKLDECIRCEVDVLIDDGPHYAEQFAEADKPVILIDQPYNKSVARELVYRAADWIQVESHVERLCRFPKYGDGLV